ncbi:MAG: hypothetical protein FWG89_00540 [Treponema sp.]|nr:hypothetical protein [Treponema sp.]
MDIKGNMATIIRVFGIFNTIIFGFFALSFFLPPYREHIYLSENGTELIGVVIRVEKSYSPDPISVSLVQYEVDEHLYIYRISGRRTVGSDVLLLINPDNPENVRLKDGSRYQIIFFIFIIISVLSLFFSLLIPWNKYLKIMRDSKNE